MCHLVLGFIVEVVFVTKFISLISRVIDLKAVPNLKAVKYILALAKYIIR